MTEDGARREGIAMGIYVYMLRCADGSFYVGSATGDDLSTRIDQHNAGTFPGYTSKRRPVLLVWSEFFDRITDGIAAERQIKGWSRAKKEALIRSDWAAVCRLAQRRGGLPKDPAKLAKEK
jgi:putative endonuclease